MAVLLQNPVVTGNSFAGLLVNGTALVTIANGTFANNLASPLGGGAIIIDGDAVVRIVRSTFNENGDGESTENKSAGVVLGHA